MAITKTTEISKIEVVGEHKAVQVRTDTIIKEDGTEITIVQSEVDTSRATIHSEAVAFKYKTDRTTDGSTTYAPIGDQLDLLWHAIDADSDLKVKFSAFYNSIKAVKDANPKP